MSRSALSVTLSLAALALVVPSRAEAQFSRERFLSSVAAPLADFARKTTLPRGALGGTLSGRRLQVDGYRIYSDPWLNLVDIAELSTLTEAGRAGYMLGMAYLASQELRIPIQTKDRGNYVLIKADGLFAANVFKNAPRGQNVAISFKSVGFDEALRANWDFETPAIKLLEEAAAGECQFSAGWYRNDTSEIDFLKRTCSDLQADVRASVQKVIPPDANTVSPQLSRSPTPLEVHGQVATAGPVTQPAMNPEARQNEINRRSRLSGDLLRAGMNNLTAQESTIVSALEKNSKRSTMAPSPKVNASPRQNIQADHANERLALETKLAQVREEIAIQSLALAIVEPLEKKAEEAKRQVEAETAARKAKEVSAMRARFAATSVGKKLYDGFINRFGARYRGKVMLPTEKAAVEKGLQAGGRCFVDRLAVEPIDEDSKVAFEIIISNLNGAKIENQIAGQLAASAIIPCTQVMGEAADAEVQRRRSGK